MRVTSDVRPVLLREGSVSGWCERDRAVLVVGKAECVLARLRLVRALSSASVFPVRPRRYFMELAIFAGEKPPNRTVVVHNMLVGKIHVLCDV